MGDGQRLRSGTIKPATAVPTSVMEISASVKEYLEQLISEQTNTLSTKIAALELKLQEKDKKLMISAAHFQ